MKLEHWQIVLQTYRQVRLLLDQYLPAEPAVGKPSPQVHVGDQSPPAEPAVGKPSPQVRVGAEVLALVQQQLLAEVNRLQQALGSAYREEEITEALRPFVYLTDGLVLRRLAGSDQEQWPMLQHRLYGIDSGGDHFYELADEKLAQRVAPPLVFELLHFCLTAGFEGRYAGNEARLREYKERLAARIPKPEAVPAPPPAVGHAPLVHAFPLRYYLVSGAVVVTLPVLLWWLSR